MYDSSPERHTPPGPAPFNQDHDITCARVHAAVIDDIPQISDQLTAVAGHISDLLGHVRKITGSEDETATRALYTTHRSLENILEDLEHTMRHVRGRTPQ